MANGSSEGSGRRYGLCPSLATILAAITLMNACMKISRQHTSSTSKGPRQGAELFAFNDASCQAIGLTQSEAFLTDNGAEEQAEQFRQDVVGMLETQLSGLEIKTLGFERLSQQQSGTALTESPVTELSKFTYQIDGIPLCQKEMIVIRNNKEFRALEKLPEFTEDEIRSARQQIGSMEWPNLNDNILEHLCQGLKRHHSFNSCPERIDIIEESGSDRCMILHKTDPKLADPDSPPVQLIPYLRLHFNADKQPYFAIVNHQGLLSDRHGEVIEKRFFSATGSAHIFSPTQSNRENFQTREVRFENLADSGYLCNKQLLTDSSFSSSFNFVFGPELYPGAAYPITDFRKYEATVFYNASQHIEWVRSLTLSKSWNGEYRGWPGPQIRIYIDASDQGLNNTAVYHPTGEGKKPTISLGNGDNIQLRNLLLDPEVVSHELGHHLAYRYLTSTRGESLDLHEGMADALVYYRTNNACLAESICPSDKVCISKKCLRSGENNYTYQSVSGMRSGHNKSQLISGLLWDIAKRMGRQNAAMLLIRAFSFLQSAGGYSSLLSALYLADQSLFRSKYYCTVVRPSAQNRGFSSLLPEDSCSSSLSSPASSSDSNK